VIRHLPEREYRRVRWKNGLGWTTEVAVFPSEGEWDWRVSIATVDADSEFSRFPGIDRSLMVLDGAGMVLDVEGQGSFTLHAGGPPLSFSGDVTTNSRLLAGPTRDFNVMTRRGVVAHVLRRHVLAGSLTFECDASVLLIHVLEGEATIGELEQLALSPGDSAVVDGPPSVVLTGMAVVLVVWLRGSR
jgi:environmental stress-induced protein Ves